MKPRLNYIDQINSFWKHAFVHSFKSKEIALYFYLLHVNNSCNWKKVFSHNNKKIEAILDVSFKTLASARQNLKVAGLIDFNTKNGTPNVDYQIISLSNFPEVWEDVRDKVDGNVSSELRDEINKTETKQNKNEIYNKIEVLKSDESWIESVGKRQNITRLEILKKLDDFEVYLKSILKQHNSKENLANHFVNWLPKNLENNGNDKSKINRQTADTIRLNSQGW